MDFVKVDLLQQRCTDSYYYPNKRERGRAFGGEYSNDINDVDKIIDQVPIRWFTE